MRSNWCGPSASSCSRCCGIDSCNQVTRTSWNVRSTAASARSCAARSTRRTPSVEVAEQVLGTYHDALPAEPTDLVAPTVGVRFVGRVSEAELVVIDGALALYLGPIDA
jgi:hypothetical protein